LKLPTCLISNQTTCKNKLYIQWNVLRLRSGVVFWNNCIFLISSSVVALISRLLCQCRWIHVCMRGIYGHYYWFCMFWRSLCFLAGAEVRLWFSDQSRI